MPLSQYHRGDICVGPSVSSSSLRKIMEYSPAHFFAYSPLNPNRRPEPDKKAFRLNRALHHLILGEAFFSKLFIVHPEAIADDEGKDAGLVKPWNNHRKKCKAWIAEQQADGKTVLTPDEVEQIIGMSKTLAENSEVREGILRGWVERSMFWQDEETGLWVKARPDSIPRNLEYGDLKGTGTTVRWDDMQKSIEDWRYYQQAALVAEGTRILFGEEMKQFTYVFVENKYPHCVDTVEIKDDDLKRGHEDNRVARRIIAHCLKTGHWYGPGGIGIRPIEMNEHAHKRVDENRAHKLSEIGQLEQDRK